MAEWKSKEAEEAAKVFYRKVACWGVVIESKRNKELAYENKRLKTLLAAGVQFGRYGTCSRCSKYVLMHPMEGVSFRLVGFQCTTCRRLLCGRCAVGRISPCTVCEKVVCCDRRGCTSGHDICQACMIELERHAATISKHLSVARTTK